MPKPRTLISLGIKRLHPDAILPKRQTEGAACFDLCALEDAYIPPLNAYECTHLVRTGLAFDIPQGYHISIYLRSSTGLYTKLRLANQIGIIDSDYRGEVHLIVENLGRTPIRIAKGARIAQFLVERDLPVAITEVKTLSETARGASSSGSTGRDL